jgi:REP element-mobilizing transposase RayT
MYERHLPHWRQEGATYFVTFRLADSLPLTKLEELRQWRQEWERKHPPPRSEVDWEGFSRHFARRSEVWLDEGFGECVLRDRQSAKLMHEAFLHFQHKRYFISCFVIMPNHCHAIVRPLGTFDLESIVGSWKGFVARELNKLRKKRGSLWQDESYDRIVRDEEHLYRVLQYIGRNPVLAGLPRDQWIRWVDPNWEAAGWRFHDPDTPTPTA